MTLAAPFAAVTRTCAGRTGKCPADCRIVKVLPVSSNARQRRPSLRSTAMKHPGCMGPRCVSDTESHRTASTRAMAASTASCDQRGQLTMSSIAFGSSLDVAEGLGTCSDPPLTVASIAFGSFLDVAEGLGTCSDPPPLS
eukprot:scaffold7335_cov289-Pinguiococcus_pyrenoidosus.AAC.5